MRTFRTLAAALLLSAATVSVSAQTNQDLTQPRPPGYYVHQSLQLPGGINNLVTGNNDPLAMQNGLVVTQGTYPTWLGTIGLFATDTYFNGALTTTTAVPAGTGGVVLPFAVDQDSGGNVTGAGTSSFAYTTKRTGHYHISVLVEFLKTGATGAPPAATAIGVLSGVQLGPNPVKYENTASAGTGANSGANFITADVEVYYPAGSVITVTAFCDAADSVILATVKIVQTS